MFPIIRELRVQKPTYIFQHYCTGLDLSNKTDCLREQVPFIVLTELL